MSAQSKISSRLTAAASAEVRNFGTPTRHASHFSNLYSRFPRAAEFDHLRVGERHIRVVLKKLVNYPQSVRVPYVMETLSQKGWEAFRFHRLKPLFCGWIVIAAVGTALANPITTDSPIGFFTNVASRLLSSELNVDLHRIQIYPTNQYTPAVHRLLQVTANIYDATTTNYYPSVFRPLFSRDQNGFGTNLFVSGYTEVASVTGPSDLQFLLPMTASDLAGTNIAVIDLPANVFGVPWIIGAKKGFPNFNEFYMESAFQLTRKIMVTRQAPMCRRRRRSRRLHSGAIPRCSV